MAGAIFPQSSFFSLIETGKLRRSTCERGSSLKFSMRQTLASLTLPCTHSKRTRWTLFWFRQMSSI